MVSRTMGRRARRVGAGATTLALVALGAQVGLSPSGAASRPHASGTVDVLYAGSLLELMQRSLAPAFHRATGYSVSGFPNGSNALASEIKGETQAADVFISASPGVNDSLAGKGNGDWLSTYSAFGDSPLVLGYNPASRFARELRAEPWYDVVGRAGFHLGRTDPATDPKGVLAVDALEGVALSYDRPRLDALATATADVFPETALVGELQAGQLDAGFFYAVEASAAHLRTVPLVGTALSATYTVARLNRAPHPAAARAFVRFLLGPVGRRLLRANGITPIVPARSVVVRGSTTTSGPATPTT